MGSKATDAKLTNEQDYLLIIPPGGESPYEVDEENERMLLHAADHVYGMGAESTLQNFSF